MSFGLHTHISNWIYFLTSLFMSLVSNSLTLIDLFCVATTNCVVVHTLVLWALVDFALTITCLHIWWLLVLFFFWFLCVLCYLVWFTYCMGWSFVFVFDSMYVSYVSILSLYIIFFFPRKYMHFQIFSLIFDWDPMVCNIF